MNLRTQELALQAKEYATTRHPTSNIILAVDGEKFEQKFAELIVKECASVVENQGRFLTYTALTKEIKKKFGVKE